MKGASGVIKALQKVLANELVAINQYFLHAKMFDNWGYGVLAAKSRQESIDEMHHADQLIARLLMLENAPSMKCPELRVGKDVTEALRGDLALEHDAVKDLNAGIKTCERDGDYVSRQLLIAILESEEQHIDWLQTQLGLIKEMGLPNYLQSVVGAGAE